MLTITFVTYSQGYTKYDHLLDSSALRGLVGRSFRSAAEARRAALAVARKNPPDRRVSLAPIYMEALVDGMTDPVTIMGET